VSGRETSRTALKPLSTNLS